MRDRRALMREATGQVFNPSIRLLLKNHWRAADSLRLKSDCYLHTVCDPDERNAAVHPVVSTVKGHCSFNVAYAFPSLSAVSIRVSVLVTPRIVKLPCT
jgi:hypothetical protein